VYGTRGQLQWEDQEYVEWLLGQAYQENENSPFPLTTSQVAHYTDYIGRLAMKYDALDVSYSFRLNRETLNPTANEVNVAYARKPVSFDITYLSLQNEPLFGDRKEVFGNTRFDLTKYWALNLGGRRDLGSTEPQAANPALAPSALNPLEPTGGTVGIYSGLEFHNECIQVVTMASRSYISEQDVKPSTTFGVTLLLKNFGALDSQPGPANMAGPGNIMAIDTGASTISDQNPVHPPGETGEASAPEGNGNTSGGGN
jgi:hypothetical protein